VSDTPRTDAAYTASTGAGIYELFQESKDIERELNTANKRIKELEAKVDELHDLEKWLEGR
jgi:predicted  nucleic acid-binding Zn-ribbon protein